ncbi:hypothetical protein CRP01_13420 [Flavilitoribacter nigricans DSM 23189 = NBRC 102662]|uniref:CBM-cenC domain-containing protein n=2 Tax=Flavilitoribacter TaxID=2762562 RepID=A0A2D0NC51_FLAN2|nr:hypothetical protein CRP01_13420 [Flavilitoribacter nigricans DSM 23189 = NBRC 102662]
MQYLSKLCLPVFLFFGLNLCGQKTISLKNPSFEGKPTMSDVPGNWRDCGFPGESAPDVQPCGAFEVTTIASDGDTYLGMVTRDNDTWEKVGTKLSPKMEAGVVYEFSIQLCQSETYQSASRLTGEPTNFITPVVLRIFGGNSYCEKEQMLGVSPPIDHAEWGTYRFTLSPQQEYSHLLLEAYYVTARGLAYCGNLLVDNASDLVPIGRSETIERASLVGERVEETRK